MLCLFIYGSKIWDLFFGFISTGQLKYLTIKTSDLSSTDPVDNFPAASQLYLASTNQLPEPEAYILVLTGLALMGFGARKRRT